MPSEPIEVLKVKLHQHTAVYRNPVTSEVIESYALPPPSTIIGFIHSLLKKMEPDPNSMNVSIQGEYSALLRDYQWYKKYDERIKSFGQKPYPILVHTLYDVSLVLHFYFPESYQDMGKEVERLLLVPPYFPYIGRAEDLVKIEEVSWRKCQVEEREKGYLRLPAYIPEVMAARFQLRGVPYKLSGYYRYTPITAKKETKFIRDFDWLNLQYVESEARFESEDALALCIDDQGDFIWWCMQNPIPGITQKH